MEFLFFFLLFIVAFLYASVGHGGASGYLALMIFFSFSPEAMRSTALILNVFVSFMAFIQFYRGGYFKWSLFLPFAITSIPAAFIGGIITIDSLLYKRILALLLIFPILKFFGFHFKEAQKPKEIHLLSALVIGALIGLLSGMIGIGGGIILSPVILLLCWADIKQTAAVSALFIFVNSIAGLAGVFASKNYFTTEIWIMLSIAVIGGISGSYYGSKKFNSNTLSKILAFVLVLAAVKLMIT